MSIALATQYSIYEEHPGDRKDEDKKAEPPKEAEKDAKDKPQ